MNNNMYKVELGSNMLNFKTYTNFPNRYWPPIETNRSWYKYYQNEVDK